MKSNKSGSWLQQELCPTKASAAFLKREALGYRLLEATMRCLTRSLQGQRMAQDSFTQIEVCIMKAVGAIWRESWRMKMLTTSISFWADKPLFRMKISYPPPKMKSGNSKWTCTCNSIANPRPYYRIIKSVWGLETIGADHWPWTKTAVTCLLYRSAWWMKIVGSLNYRPR